MMTSIAELFHFRVKSKQQKICFWILVIYLVLLAGFRYGLESDYWHYYNIFQGKQKVSTLEVGFKLFIAIIRLCTKNYAVFCVVVAIVTCGIKSHFLSKLQYPFIALFCYYLRFYVLFDLNAIRQGMAMSFVMIAIYFLMKNDKKKYFLFIVLAILFHTVAVCGLIPLVLKNRNIGLKQIIIIYVCFVLYRLILFDTVIDAFNSFIPYVLNSTNSLIHGTQYIINSGDKMGVLNFGSFARIIIPGICLFMITDKDQNSAFYNMYFMGTVINLVFWGLDTISFRLPAVLYIYEAFLLNDSLLKNKLFGKKRRDWVFTICFFAIAFCDMWSFFSMFQTSTTLVPYRSIWG